MTGNKATRRRGVGESGSRISYFILFQEGQGVDVALPHAAIQGYNLRARKAS